MSAVLTIPDESRWIDIIPELLNKLGDRNIIFLKGDLGAGKTTLIKYIYAFLEGDITSVQSPTFSLIHEYPIRSDQLLFDKIFHLDLYRLKSIDELLAIGLQDIADQNVLLLIEWPELSYSLFDQSEYLEIEIIHQENGRALIFNEIENV